MDVLWFRLSRRETDPIASLDLRFGAGQFVIFIDRFDYWQMGIVIAKGGYQRSARLVGSLRQTFAQTVPEFADRVDDCKIGSRSPCCRSSLAGSSAGTNPACCSLAMPRM